MLDQKPATGSMQAWRQDRYGDADAVSLGAIDVPVPGRREVRVRLRATGLNNGDVRVMRGEPLLVRAVFGVRRPRQPVRGMDAAATVVAVGPGVTEVSVGDEVVGELPGGGLAPYALAPVARLVRRPSEVDPVRAATLPVAGGTAWQALDLAGLGATAAVAEGARDRRVLMIGASGGVGTFAVQLAVHRGAEVWALCGARNLALIESLGAAQVFDYRVVQPGMPELPAGTFDAVIDIAGAATLPELQHLVRDGGRVVLVSGQGGRVIGPIGRIIGAAFRSVGSKRRIRPLAATADPEALEQLLELVASGNLHPVIERRFSFAEARDALAHVAAGHTTGKVVVVAD